MVVLMIMKYVGEKWKSGQASPGGKATSIVISLDPNSSTLLQPHIKHRAHGLAK
jgi:hypothetical protein